MMPDDTQYEEYSIEAVKDLTDSYELALGGWSLWCPKRDGLPDPSVGEKCRLYGRGIGSPVRGIVIEGRVYRYQTELEQEREHAQ